MFLHYEMCSYNSYDLSINIYPLTMNELTGYDIDGVAVQYNVPLVNDHYSLKH